MKRLFANSASPSDSTTKRFTGLARDRRTIFLPDIPSPSLCETACCRPGRAPAVRYELERSWKQSILEKLQARFPKTVREVHFHG